jgi:predicted nucleotidyltransferase component of viral defense system
MGREAYAAQVEFLVRLLPLVAEEEVFALKGGTAINLFYRDLPRLSVDIDLTYLPIRDRAESLAAIDEALARIAASIERTIPGARAQRIAGGGDGATRILARLGQTEIKVETSPVTRGVVHDPEWREVSEPVQNEFGFAEIQVVSFEDLFGGKLHAAVDRQHPRDLFDVKLLYENEGLTDALFRTFLVYVASSSRPPHELLDPHPIDLDQVFAREFSGMTAEPTDLADLIAMRAQLTEDIKRRLDDGAKKFLLSLHDANPNFSTIGLPQAAELPAVKWKLQNLEQLILQNPAKHAAQRQRLEDIFTQ